MPMDIIRYLQAHINIKNERGAALVEYALLLALIAVVCIIALNALGGEAKKSFEDVGASIGAAGS